MFNSKSRLRNAFHATGIMFVVALNATLTASEPQDEFARRLAAIRFEHYATAPGYSEGPTWRNGEVLFCSGALLRVDLDRKVHRYLEIGPAGTVLRADGHLLICDNKYKALLQLAPNGKVSVLADRFGIETLRSLNDLTLDAKGNIYWTDPEGSSLDKPVGHIYRLRPDGRVDRIGTGLAFPNGIEVDPSSKHLYVIESQSKRVLRYDLPPEDELLGAASQFYDLGGSGGDGCAFDADGNLWVADFHRPETGKGRITVLSPAAKVLAYLPLPSKLVSNIAFGGPDRDELFCTTGDPPGVFHAKVGVKGFPGHPGVPGVVLRRLNVVPIKSHPDADVLANLVRLATRGITDSKSQTTSLADLNALVSKLTDPQVRDDCERLIPQLQPESQRAMKDQTLVTEIKRLGGKAVIENFAPEWLRSILGDESLALFGRIVEVDLNERVDGHAKPIIRKPEDRVTDDWLVRLSGQSELRQLELSGTAVTGAGLVHLKDLRNIERLNLCLTEVDDRGFEHLAGMTKLRRLIVCSSKVTGVGFRHFNNMKLLESINLHSSPANDAGLEAIGKLTSLNRLEIVHTRVTDTGLRHLAGLTNLKQLHIHGPETTSNALPFLSQLQNLEQLDIYDKAASNLTLQQIGQLHRLRTLMLVNGTFDDSGLKHLASVLTLEELAFDSPNVTDGSVEVLGGLKKLRRLHLGNSGLTASGRARVKAMLPTTVVTP